MNSFNFYKGKEDRKINLAMTGELALGRNY